jgi:endo-1,4-beta-xylanase
VDPTQLPGYGMTFSASVVPGERDTRTVTITATNGDVGPAYTTQITGFTLTQLSGPSCSPKITAPASYPIALGDIPTSGTASASFVVSIVGCNPNSQFTLSVPWSSAVYDTGTFTTTLDFKRGNGN